MDTDLTKALEKITGKSKSAVKKREIAERRVKRNLEHYIKEEAAKLRQEIEKFEFIQKPDFLGDMYEKLKNKAHPGNEYLIFQESHKRCQGGDYLFI